MYKLILFSIAAVFITGCSADSSQQEASTGAKQEAVQAASMVKNSKKIDSPSSKNQGVTNNKAPVNNKDVVELTFAGDVMFANSLIHTTEQEGFDYPFQYVKEHFQNDDFTFVNLETSVTERGIKEEKIYNYRTKPEAMDALKSVGIDGLALGNNHTLDYGTQGLLDTISYVEKAGLATIGAGKNKKEAYSSFTKTFNGKKIAFLSFSKVLPKVEWYALENRPGIASGYQLDRMTEIIRKAETMHDYVFVQIHWGEMGDTMFNETEQTYAHEMIDAGADAIIGSHPHVLQGFEYYEGKLIAYSLGNLLFPDFVHGEEAQTGLLEVKILESGKLEYSFLPHLIQDDVITIHPNEKELLNRLEARSLGVTITKNHEIINQN
ncbi:CapA family protein [Thalassobacillus pellis]|uniref:CapA family protein n=1 Tax=Thalassobacillus pellis TaxID=748008 RepID=UPI00196060C9|nr:CapA family protein [Thalassobacillus pellis]MBM7553011.1 poly-gamma-glutamate synthesis protein (capsule biosynthesis protein) [Thalassobacillus pellis]